MQSGLCVSYGKYYLLSEEHDGHFGHMIKNGEVYKGIQITADTSSGTEGALSDEMIAKLGLDKSKAFDVTGSQHVTDGEVTPPAPAPEQNTNNEESSFDITDSRSKYFGDEEVSVNKDSHGLS